jgi:hypothetical protein
LLGLEYPEPDKTIKNPPEILLANYLNIFIEEKDKATWKSFSSKLLMFSRQNIGSLCIGEKSR